jgi:twitching motility two-component system response regulator PilG
MQDSTYTDAQFPDAGTPGENAPEQLRAAVAAAREGDKDGARDLLRELLEEDPDNEQGLLWSAALAESVDDAFWFLQKLLQIDPGNAQASKILAMHEVRESMRRSPGRLAQATVEAGIDIASSPKKWQCPLCLASASSTPRRCPRCHSIMSLWDLDAVLRNEGTDEELISEALYSLARHAVSEPGFESSLHVALAHLNLRHSVEALPWLRKASEFRSDPAVARAIETLENRKLVLAVDDSALVRRVVTVILERNGYCAVTASDGMQAIARLNEAKPALVLLDIEMPRLNGLQLCKMMKKNPFLKSIPVLLLTGNDTLGDKLKGKVAGAADYLIKPLDEVDLLRAVAQHIGR